ncbi:hypothetical protein BCV70DRAFT_208834 [Testicularia cyperi]|uniref:K Homology domain-containing protein n=1 Tax=Testicularia cyperi TaxID=1882483 RepID=A0A317XFB5_9BASI|nr:hypothetical protein BCV70DRAFT_208834 [Testicularia cyperi]
MYSHQSYLQILDHAQGKSGLPTLCTSRSNIFDSDAAVSRGVAVELIFPMPSPQGRLTCFTMSFVSWLVDSRLFVSMSSRWDSPQAATGSGSGGAEASTSSPAPPASDSSATKTDAAAAAAAAAAKIAATLASARPAASGSHSSPNTTGNGNASSKPDSDPSSSSHDGSKRDHRDVHDADFTHDIEINDQRNRYMLTKGQTQQQIHRETGASVTTKGTWYPDKTLATKEEPPLYLHISATSQEILDSAIEKITDLMAQDLPQLVEDRHQRRLDYENQRPPPRERRRWPEEKILVNLESIRNFNVRSKIVGPGGMFVKYIQNETGTRVQIKGVGSGFIETDTGAELPEPMHIAIAGPEEEQIKAAKALAEDLLEVVRAEWQKHYDGMGPGGGGGYGGPPGGGYDRGGPRGGRGDSNGYGQYGGHSHHHQGGWEQGGHRGGGGWNQNQGRYSSAGPGSDGGYGHAHAQPPAPDGLPPPPPPEDDAPPPPPTEAAADSGRDPRSARSASGAGRRDQDSSHSQYARASSNASDPAPASASASSAPRTAMSPEEEALDKYWREYVQWEQSFQAYHNRLPSKDEGGQDVPPQYRK